MTGSDLTPTTAGRRDPTTGTAGSAGTAGTVRTADGAGTTGPSMLGRVCLVTGAAGGMGAAIATSLARSGATVVLVARDRAGGEAVARAITTATGNTRVEVLIGDLSDQSAVRRLAAEFTAAHRELHVLVNTAGAHFRVRSVSADGIEMHLAVNHLAPFLLTNLLLGALQAGAPSRIVNIGSASMSDTRQVRITRTARPVVLDLDDLQSRQHFAPMEVYARSKLQLLMCGYAFARRLAGSGVTVNTVHPGLTATSVVDAIAAPALAPLLPLVKRLLLTAEEGARAAVHLATSPWLEKTTGRYFLRQVQARSPEFTYDTALQDQLFDASARLVGLPTPAVAAVD